MSSSINCVTLSGRLTRDPEVRYTTSQLCCAKFTLAVNNGKDKDGKERPAYYPSVVAWGKLGETVEKYVTKGQLVIVQGKLSTSVYEKEGQKIYATEVIANQILFTGKAENKQTGPIGTDIPEGFEQVTDDDIPF